MGVNVQLEILHSDWTAIILQQNKSGYRASTRPSIFREGWVTPDYTAAVYVTFVRTDSCLVTITHHWQLPEVLGLILSSIQRLVSCPDPPEKQVWCSEQLFTSHGAGLNGIKNVIIAFPMHCMHTRFHARLPTSLYIVTHSAI